MKNNNRRTITQLIYKLKSVTVSRKSMSKESIIYSKDGDYNERKT